MARSRRFMQHLLFWGRKKQFKLRLERNKACKIKLLTPGTGPQPALKRGGRKGAASLAQRCATSFIASPSDLRSCTWGSPTGQNLNHSGDRTVTWGQGGGRRYTQSCKTPLQL